MRHFVITFECGNGCDPIITNYTTINITWSMARRGMISTLDVCLCSQKCHIPSSIKSPIVSKYFRGIHQIFVRKGHLECVEQELGVKDEKNKAYKQSEANFQVT